MRQSLIYSPCGAAAIAPAVDFRPSLCMEFVAWIDRSEKTTSTYIKNLRQFLAWLKYSAITRPIREDIISYRQWLTVEHDAIVYAPDTTKGWAFRTDGAGKPIKVICRASTVKQYLQSVRQFFKWAAACGYYPDIAANIHAPKITTTTHRKEALSAADVLAIENSITAGASAMQAEAAAAIKDKLGKEQRSTEQGKRLLAMYLLAVNAGLRTVELSRANVKDLEVKGGSAWLWVWGKGHAEPDQRKPIAPEVAAAIKEYIASRTDHPTGNSPLFVSTGNRSHGKRIAPTTISTMLKQAMQAAGYDSERITAHSLRHTAGTNAMELTNNNIYLTQQYMRHSSPATTEIYLHQDTEQQTAEIAQRLYNHYHGKK